MCKVCKRLLIGGTLACVVAVTMLPGATAQDPAPWLSADWDYRKSATVTTASDNYQTRILVGESSGATGEDVDCGGKVQADFDDLRFTGSDGVTLLDYWIESINGTTPNQLAAIWVENNATASTTVYMYYGNVGATAASNGTNTFLFFDDFERGSNGDALGGVWTVIQGAFAISTDHASSGTRCAKAFGNTTPPFAQATYTTGTGYGIRLRGWKEPNTIDTDWCLHGDGVSGTYFITNSLEDIKYYDGAWHDTGYQASDDAWDLWEVNNINWSAHTYDIWCNGTKVQSAAGTYNTTSWANKLIMYTGSVTLTRDAYWDDILVRKWAATEQTFGSWGNEEVAPVGYTFGYIMGA